MVALQHRHWLQQQRTAVCSSTKPLLPGFLVFDQTCNPPLIIMDRTTVIGCFLKKINDAAIACISLVSCYNHERKVEIIL
mmetsp:Transcript_12634/g.22521  ORF Transcript_12634/g.22521 Transcript_12634/m.22521 type:complete len:80 (+) Transcript_12634:1318-1557(+)